TRSVEGAAVRDLDGRTYAAAAVDLASLRLSALEVCVAMAVTSGARGLEAAVRLGDDSVPDLRAVRELGGDDVVVHLGDARGEVTGIA
ncbi:MAG: cytidine deaminase, partial [Nocardioides sp.]